MHLLYYRKDVSIPIKRSSNEATHNMHRLLQRHANEASTPSGTVISPLVTPTSTPTTSTSPPFGSVSTPSSTPAPSSAPASTTILSSTPASTHTPSTPPLFGTVSAPSSTQPPSSAPSSTETPSTPISTEQQDGRIHIKVRENALLPLGKCSTIIKKSFLDKVDENGYKWVTISEEIKQFYWEEFQKKYQWDAVVGGKAPPTHNGGSASHQQIAADMEEYTGQAPSCYDVFMFTHTKDHDGKTFQVDKAKEVHDLFVSRHADLALLGEEVDESELFYTVVRGHDRKRRIYGLGSYDMSIFRENSSQTCTSPDTTCEKHHLETKIQKL
ncbi:unnamed protein product [Lactuca virosa]|uniref:Uncharacterized protein n=1 Tax=Lactuca virosa TaxID=75947 RepID=A0AAU9NG65_9ASTR|nr:unnamed protein product [Lactuca virosa]